MSINEQALADGFAQLAQATSLAKVRAAGAALQKAVTPTVTPTPAPAPAPVSTTTTGVWKDQLGVCTHLSYFGTPNGVSTGLHDKLVQLGVRHIRDGWGTGSAAADDFVKSFNGALQLTFVCDPRDGNDPIARVAHLKTLAQAGVLDTIEGPNEPGGWDGNPASLLNGWTATAWLTKIRDLVRADPTFANVKLAAMSLADTNTTSKYQAFGPIAGLDYGVTHDYPGDQHQMTDAIAQTAQANARIIAGAGKPVIATETGFTTGSGGPYTPVTEQQQADLSVQLAKIHQANGVRRTFLYVLAATTTGNAFEDSFGLLRADLTPKPAFAAIQTLLAS